MKEINSDAILMIIDKKYDDFGTCFTESEESIYRKMIDVYKRLENSEDGLFLVVHATIEKRSFNTTYPINKASSELITSVIIPYFETIEDYETCDEALKIYQRINR